MPTVYITTPADAADALAERLVADRLAACVNMVPCTSVYRWEGEVVHDEEVIVVAKTTDAGYDRLEAALADVHPYDVPCIERFDERDALPSFADWVEECVRER
jgi:periplasmic divalent cation tolerance protein